MPGLTVVFDLDGTLVETAPDLIDALNAVFAREGLPPPVPFTEGAAVVAVLERVRLQLAARRDVGRRDLARRDEAYGRRQA